MDKPKIIIFSGYARSGKTKFLTPVLERHGYKVASSSQTLHKLTVELIAAFFGAKAKEQLNTQDKQERYTFTIFSDTTGFIDKFQGIRELMKAIAEDCIVKILTRKVFAYNLLDEINNAWQSDASVAVETIGGEEFQLLYNQMTSQQQANTLFLNLRRQGEQPKADYRQLIPNGIDIDNQGGTQDDLYNLIEEVLIGRDQRIAS